MSTTVKEKTGLAGVLSRITSVVRLVRPVDLPVPPYKACAACGRGGRDDQQVPDPGQFTTKKGVTPSGDVVGNASTVPAKAPDPIEVNWGAFNTDPGAAAARLSDEEMRRRKDGTDVRLIDAAPVWCEPCRAWYHAVHCYSLHHHKGWKPASSVTD